MTFNQFKESTERLLNTNFDRAFGLDISDGSIELIELSKLILFSVQTYGRVDLPEGIVKEGKIVDEKLLADKIKELLQSVKPSRVATNKISLSLPDAQVMTHALVLRGALPRDLRAAIALEVTKILPIQPTLLYWDFKTKLLPDGTTFVVFVGVPRTVADSYVRVCNAIGLRIVSFGLEPLSIARAIIHEKNKHALILDIGASYTNASIVYNQDELDMSVYIPIGGKQMSESVSKTLGVTFAEAEKIKITESTRADVVPLIDAVFNEILSEAKKVITYYEESFKATVDDVFLVGGSSLVPNSEQKITAILGKKVSLIRGFNELGGKNASSLLADARDAVLYAPVIGLGMLGASNQFQDLNLIKQMPKAVLDEVKTIELFRSGYVSRARAIRIFFNNRIVLGVMSIVVLGVGFLFAYQLSQYQLHKGLEALQSQPKAVLIHENAPVTATTTVATSTATSTASTTKNTPQIVVPKKK